jgi:RimJ/RimL family protein N-acetyltransferase
MDIDWAKPTLVGTLVTLRPYRDDDFEAFWEMVNDAEGRLLTDTTVNFDHEQTRSWITAIQTAQERFDLAIIENATGEYAGEVVLNEYDREAKTLNFRISLRGPAWFGRGLGTEATRLMCDFGFEATDARQIELEVLAVNPRARASYVKAGFVTTRTYVDHDRQWVEMKLTREGTHA